MSYGTILLPREAALSQATLRRGVMGLHDTGAEMKTKTILVAPCYRYKRICPKPYFSLITLRPLDYGSAALAVDPGEVPSWCEAQASWKQRGTSRLLARWFRACVKALPSRNTLPRQSISADSLGWNGLGPKQTSGF